MDYLISNCNRDFANRNKVGQTPLFILGILYGLVNGSSRFLWGWLMDKYGFKKLMFVISTIEIIVGSSLYFMVKYDYVYVILVLFVAACIGGSFSILAPVFNKIFGLGIGPEVYGLTGISIGIANFSGPLLTKYMLEENKDFLIAFLVGSTLCVIKVCVLLLFDENDKYVNKHLEKI